MNDRLRSALDWLAGAFAVVVAILAYSLLAFAIFAPFDYLASGGFRGAADSAVAGFYLAAGPIIALLMWSFGRTWCQYGWDERDSVLKWSFPLLASWLSLPITTHVVSCLTTLAGFPWAGGALYAVRYESVILFPFGVLLGAMGYSMAAEIFSRLLRRGRGTSTPPSPPAGPNASQSEGQPLIEAQPGVRDLKFASA